MDNQSAQKPLGPSDADILSRAFLCGEFDLALALARLHPESLNSLDSAGRHNFLNFFNSGKVYSLSAQGRVDVMRSLFSLGADPFATQTGSDGKISTPVAFISFWRTTGGPDRIKVFEMCLQEWVRGACEVCRDNPGLAMRGLLSRLLFDDFQKDEAAGVFELASLCDPKDPLLPDVFASLKARLSTQHADNDAGYAKIALCNAKIKALEESFAIESAVPTAPSGAKPPRI